MNCDNCKKKLKNDQPKQHCYMYVDKPDYTENCWYYDPPIKPFLSGHIRFESRDKEIVVVPMYEGRDLI